MLKPLGLYCTLMPPTMPAESSQEIGPSAAKRARTAPADVISDAVDTNGEPEYIYCFEVLNCEDVVLIGRSKDPDSELEKLNSIEERYRDGSCIRTLNSERDLHLLYERFQYVRMRNPDDCFEMTSEDVRAHFQLIIEPLFIYESEQRAAAAAVAADDSDSDSDCDDKTKAVMEARNAVIFNACVKYMEVTAAPSLANPLAQLLETLMCHKQVSGGVISSEARASFEELLLDSLRKPVAAAPMAGTSTL